MRLISIQEYQQVPFVLLSKDALSVVWRLHLLTVSNSHSGWLCATQLLIKFVGEQSKKISF